MLNRVRSVMLMTLLGLILVSAGGYVGGQNGATMMFIIALILNFYSYWNSDKIVLKAYNAKELSENQVPELFSLIKKCGNPYAAIVYYSHRNSECFCYRPE